MASKMPSTIHRFDLGPIQRGRLPPGAAVVAAEGGLTLTKAVRVVDDAFPVADAGAKRTVALPMFCS